MSPHTENAAVPATLQRNDPCHCGSGKKYKRCHLKEDQARLEEEARNQAHMKIQKEIGAYEVTGKVGMATRGLNKAPETSEDLNELLKQKTKR